MLLANCIKAVNMSDPQLKCWPSGLHPLCDSAAYGQTYFTVAINVRQHLYVDPLQPMLLDSKTGLAVA